MSKIYFDNAATTPVDPRVVKAMQLYCEKDFGNASSLHEFGASAAKAVDQARRDVAVFFNCLEEEVFFTSGATESNNLALLGLIKKISQKNQDERIHIITSVIEHDAILEPLKSLGDLVSVTYLPVGAKGVVKLADIKKAIRPETVLVSIMYVNNEIGTIQPISAIGRLLAKENIRRLKNKQSKIYFHTDATQALSYCDVRLNYLHADLISFSAHKIYGPKGVGGLIVRRQTPLAPLMYGGHQQKNLRPGTYNVAGIVGLATALNIILDKSSHRQEVERLRVMRDKLISGVERSISKVKINGDLEKRVPANININFSGVEGESVLLMLSQQGIAVSTGSACSSGSLDPSHVLLALGVKPEDAHGSIRFSFGRFNTLSEVKHCLKVLPPIIQKLRTMSPLK